MEDEHQPKKNITDTLSSQTRTASIDSTQSEPVGALLYVSTVDLQELNVNPHTTDWIAYQITTIGGQQVLTLCASDEPHAQSAINNQAQE